MSYGKFTPFFYDQNRMSYYYCKATSNPERREEKEKANYLDVW